MGNGVKPSIEGIFQQKTLPLKMAALEGIREDFLCGSYQSVINEVNNAAFTSSLNPKDQASCKVLLFRRYEGLNLYFRFDLKRRKNYRKDFGN